MAVDIIKSPLQIKHEIEKTRKELSSLLTNWNKKKNTSLAKLLTFRAELKELDAVLAETEKGYRAYCLLLHPLSNWINAAPDRLNHSLTALQKLHPDLACCLTSIVEKASGLGDPEATETSRVLRAREAHKNASEHILRKTRDIYAAMKEEKGNVEAYSARLAGIIAEKNLQLQHQIKIYGVGL
jgi:chromosome segregation ATPase